MKTMKKKIFTKTTFLFLALMMMLTSLNLGVFAENVEMPETTITDECCFAEESVVIGEQPMVVEMATDTGGHKNTDNCFAYSVTPTPCYANGVQCTAGVNNCSGGKNHGATTTRVLVCGY